MPIRSSSPTSPPTEASLCKRALRLLGRREYTRREMAERLTRWGADPEQVKLVLGSLQADGLLSEERYAQSWVRYRLERGDGPRRLRNGLSQAGLDQQLIDQALPEDEDWGARLEAVRCRHFGTTPPADWEEWARQARYLERRGYAPELIRRQLPRPIAASASADEILE